MIDIIKRYAIAFLIVLASLACLSAAVGYRLSKALREERDVARRNTESLLGEVRQYRVRDSLNGARVQALELTLRDYERFRADDAALIKDLQTRNRKLEAVTKAQGETIISISAPVRDTVIVRESAELPALAVHCGDEWYDFDGVVFDGRFKGVLRNRERLVAVESVEYRRFLGFLWRTKQVKDRTLDVVSKNPHTVITGVEYITLTK